MQQPDPVALLHEHLEKPDRGVADQHVEIGQEVELAISQGEEAADLEVTQTAVVRGTTSLGEIRSVAELVCGRGRAGSRVVREFLGNPLAGASALERRVAAILEPYRAAAVAAQKAMHHSG